MRQTRRFGLQLFAIVKIMYSMELQLVLLSFPYVLVQLDVSFHVVLSLM